MQQGDGAVESTEERLRRELVESFRNRAHLYRLMLDEMEVRLGPAEAERILASACHRRGEEVARAAFSGFGPNDARAIGEAFLAASPDGGSLYPTEVTRNAHGIAFRVLACPLKSAWQDANLPPERVAQLCRVAGAFDRGLFEATGVRFENETWNGGEGCCLIRLSDGG
jgi:hypothetical protein